MRCSKSCSLELVYLFENVVIEYIYYITEQKIISTALKQPMLFRIVTANLTLADVLCYTENQFNFKIICFIMPKDKVGRLRYKNRA